MSEINSAWLAGIIDADGFIVAKKDSAGNYVPGVGISQKSKTRLVLIQDTFGGWFTHTKGVNEVRWHGSNAKQVLEAVAPYLRFKHKQAQYALEMISFMGSRGTRPGEEAKQRRIELAKLIVEANNDCSNFT